MKVKAITELEIDVTEATDSGDVIEALEDALRYSGVEVVDVTEWEIVS